MSCLLTFAGYFANILLFYFYLFCNTVRMENSRIIFMFLILTFNKSLALDCYQCIEEDNNRENCIKTIETCRKDEDTCYTEVIWKARPHWVKRYYISKGCSTKCSCETSRATALPECKYNPLENWRCVDCCSSDKCNYDVKLSGNLERSSLLLILSSAITAIALQDVWK